MFESHTKIIVQYLTAVSDNQIPPEAIPRSYRTAPPTATEAHHLGLGLTPRHRKP